MQSVTTADFCGVTTLGKGSVKGLHGVAWVELLSLAGPKVTEVIKTYADVHI